MKWENKNVNRKKPTTKVTLGSSEKICYIPDQIQVFNGENDVLNIVL